MQQIRDFVAVMNVGCRDAGAMDQSRLAVRTDVQLHSEVPVLAFLGLVHLGIACFVLILGRGRCGNQRRIDNRATGKPHAVGHQQFADFGEERSPKLMSLKQVTEVHQRRGIRNALLAQVNSTELPEDRNIVQGILTGDVAQIEPVGNAVHAQHSLNSHRWPTVARLRVMRFDQRAEFGPRHQSFHARQKLRLACRPTVLLESSARRQRHLLHRFSPGDQLLQSDPMTKESFTVLGTYSAFP